MKNMMTAVVVVSVILMGSMAFAYEGGYFYKMYVGENNKNFNISSTTTKAIDEGQSFYDILNDAKQKNIDIDATWNIFATSAHQAGVSGLAIWTELKKFVSSSGDIGQVSGWQP